MKAMKRSTAKTLLALVLAVVLTLALCAPALAAKTVLSKQSLTVKWAKRAEATGYELQYALKSSFTGSKTVKIQKNTTVSTTIGKLKTGKVYYIRLRAYKTAGNKTFYSAWSKAKSVKVQ